MVTKAQPKTRQQKIDERKAELDWQAQMQANWEAERIARQAEHEAFAQRVQAAHQAIDTHIKRSWAQREDRPMTAHEMARARAEIEQEAYAQVQAEIPQLDQLYAADTAQKRLEAEEAEAARQAALTPHDLWISTLTWTERQKVVKWEQINHRPYPVTGSESEARV